MRFLCLCCVVRCGWQVRLKDQRVPRLADIEMRPALAGRKSKGTLDAHTNGLRFTGNKTGETVDIM
jgi:nucleosome binding factor SPN SPT16 subunit